MNMKYGEFKWTEIREVDKSKIVILPLASMEQHGHHMPLLTDTILTTGIIERVEEKMKKDILVLPVFWVGSSHHHLEFPGTVSVEGSLYEQIISQMLDCIILAGFRKIFLFIGHGGNVIPSLAALTKTRLKHREIKPLFLVASCYWDIARESMRQVPGIKTPRLTHACEYETSMCLFLQPELVDIEKDVGVGAVLDSDYQRPDEWISNRVELAVSFKEITATGALGRPDFASREKGEKLVKAIVLEIISFLKDFKKWTSIKQEKNPDLHRRSKK